MKNASKELLRELLYSLGLSSNDSLVELATKLYCGLHEIDEMEFRKRVRQTYEKFSNRIWYATDDYYELLGLYINQLLEENDYGKI